MCLSDYIAATKFMKAKRDVYILVSVRNDYHCIVGVFEDEKSAIVARDRCVINDDSADYYIELQHVFSQY